MILSVTVLPKGVTHPLFSAYSLELPGALLIQEVAELFLASNFNTVIGQAAGIQINSQDCFSLRQGHTWKRRVRGGIVGTVTAKPDNTLCAEVKCQLILIHLHLRDLPPQGGGNVSQQDQVHLDFVLVCQF